MHKELYHSPDLLQVFLWIVDAAEDIEMMGSAATLSATPSKTVCEMAHKMGCCSRYHTQKRKHKALRRLIRVAKIECPELLEEAWRKTNSPAWPFGEV